METLKILIVAICIGFFVALLASFIWTCVCSVAKAIAKEPYTANLGKHIVWMGILAFIIFLFLL